VYSCFRHVLGVVCCVVACFGCTLGFGVVFWWVVLGGCGGDWPRFRLGRVRLEKGSHSLVSLRGCLVYVGSSLLFVDHQRIVDGSG